MGAMAERRTRRHVALGRPRPPQELRTLWRCTRAVMARERGVPRERTT